MHKVTMTLYELTKKYSDGKGIDTMWKAVEVISADVEKYMNEEQREHLLREVYNIVSTGHYNEDFAHEDMEKMYYTDENDKKHYAPYWSDSDLKSVYDKISDQIPGIPFWDFAVALNMIKSDFCIMLHNWFPNATEAERMDKLVDLTISWLNDEDSPYGKNKIWGYLNAPK